MLPIVALLKKKKKKRHISLKLNEKNEMSFPTLNFNEKALQNGRFWGVPGGSLGLPEGT